MNAFRTLLFGGLASAGLMGLMVANVAVAQSIPSAPRNNEGVATGPVVQPKEKPNNAKEPLPAAIPGAESHGEPAPAQKSALDMEPNDALFDAINRGDIASARDALNRGADIYAKNVLGMSPTELSVDLGRNDITFLLLSMRGSAGDSRLPPSKSAAAQPPARPGKRGRGPAVEAASSAPAPTASAGDIFADPNPPPAPSRPVTPPRPLRTAAAPAQPVVQYAAGSSGAPIPQMGFLGFGGSQK